MGVAKARDRDEPGRGGRAARPASTNGCSSEEEIAGREIEVGILGDDPPEASVPGEIVPGDDFYTYADKYEHDDAQLLAPAPITDEQADTVRDLAIRGFEACRCEAMARVDFFLEERRADGSPGRGFLINEVNTIPGLTAISMYPRLWELSGVSYSQLFDRLIELAMARHVRRSRRAGRQRDDDAAIRRAPGRCQMLTTGQVNVRVMPSTAWICFTTMRAMSSRVAPSVRTITS